MTKQEAHKFIERIQEAGDEWTEEQVMRAYRDMTLEEAVSSRLRELDLMAQNLVLAKEHISL